jgi:glycosyltransferase involved in cell wall biosynthesis
MVMAPRVSILIPVYKTAPYLREAMDSMLSQTFTDFELIVLNDFSPDNAEEILDTYDDPRIVRYKGEKNVGLSNVLNVGIRMAKGKYIARMDSDDISLPNRLQTQFDYLESHPDIDLCSCGMQLFGAKEDVWLRESNPEKVKITALFFSPVLHASSMWRKDSFEKQGLFFRQEMVPAEDYDLWTRALVKGLRLVNLPEVLYRYRLHPNQATLQTDKTKIKSREVQKAYLKAALPSLSEKTIGSFPEKLWPVFFSNLRKGFFDKRLLAKRLYKMSKVKNN